MSDIPRKTVVINSIRFAEITEESHPRTQATTVDTSIKHENLDFSAVDISKVTETDKVTDYVIIKVADHGDIVVRLFPEVAPETVANFKTLVEDKFYDGLIFHRVIKDFMIQGGGLDTSLNEKDASSIKGEFKSNGFANNLLHVRGVISMARSDVPDSASSQFFIMHKDSPHLDGDYAAFGYVVSGIEVVDSIASVSTDSYDIPQSNVVITSIRFAEVAK
ncbi:MAG: peptidylprolyl isomerase [Clostridia bacterium]|nr:peptidylprolyl isomerase [Clostridia bacterium]